MSTTHHPILILFAHPEPHRSRVNLRLLDAVRDLPGVRVNDLYENYPAFHIDVAHEQGLLRESELVVFHHPFYWYSAPALLKHWQDNVLEYGFAYGRDGNALHGKRLLSVITTGHSRAAYGPEGDDHYTMKELLRPFQQTARHCGMEYEPPLILHAVHRLDTATIDAHAKRYRERLESFLTSTTAEPSHG